MRDNSTVKILIVDDDEDMRLIYSRYLLEEGFQVLTASSGQKALEDFREEDFDVALLDISMPTGDIHEFIPDLQKIHRRSKIIVSSCYDVHFQKASVSNADEYYDKTHGCEELLTKIKTVLSRKPDVQDVR